MGGGTCPNCGGQKGKHLGGCNLEGRKRQRREADFTASQQRVADSMKRRARDYVSRNSGTLFTTYCPPNTNGMPPGVRMQAVEHRGEKMYKIVLE